MNGIERELFIIIVAVSAIAVLQFFKGRKLNLLIMRWAIDVFERTYNPVDKVYRLIGLYVGFRAVYWFNHKRLSRAEVTLTLLPRYSAFYLPIAKIVSRFDRVYITYWFNSILEGEAHLVREGAYRRSLKSIIRSYDSLNIEYIEVKGVRFVALYSNRSNLMKLLRFVERLPDPRDINHVAVIPTNNSLYLYARLRIETFKDLVAQSFELAKRFV